MADDQMASIADHNNVAWSTGGEQSTSSGLSLPATLVSVHATAFAVPGLGFTPIADNRSVASTVQSIVCEYASHCGSLFKVSPHTSDNFTACIYGLTVKRSATKAGRVSDSINHFAGAYKHRAYYISLYI